MKQCEDCLIVSESVQDVPCPNSRLIGIVVCLSCYHDRIKETENKNNTSKHTIH